MSPRTLCFVVFIVVVAVPAAAEPTRPIAQDQAAARQHYARGRALVTQKKFEEAFAAFAAGYEASKRPLFLFNMGECARALEDFPRARTHYERYLAESPNGDLAAAARERLAALPRMTAPPAPTTPDPTPTPMTTSPAPTVPPPAEAAATTSISTRPALVVEMRASSSPRIYERPVFWIGLGVALAAGTVAIYAATRDDGSPMSCTQPGCIDLR